MELDQLVGNGLEQQRSHEAWYPLSGRHCDGLQVHSLKCSDLESNFRLNLGVDLGQLRSSWRSAGQLLPRTLSTVHDIARSCRGFKKFKFGRALLYRAGIVRSLSLQSAEHFI